MPKALSPLAPQRHARWLLLVLSASFGTKAVAGEWSWGTFGTLGAYRAQGEGVRLRPDGEVAHSAGDGEWRTDGDTKWALQGRWDPGGSWAFVGQVMTRDDVERGHRPQLTWLYASGALAPGWTLRLGRQTLPTLRWSENRHVGIAQAAVRPQPAVYRLNPGTPLDGATLVWEGDWAEGALELDLGVGRTSVTRQGQRIDVRQSTVGSAQWRRGPWSVGAGLAGYRLDLSRNPLGAFSDPALCTNCAQLMLGPASHQAQRGRLMNLQLGWDVGAWALQGEWIDRFERSSVLTPKARGWYLQGLHRSGDWTLHASVGELRFREPSLGLQPGPGASTAVQAQLAAVDRWLQSPQDQRVLQLGLRRNWGPHWAWKVQWERWDALRDASTGRVGEVNLAAPPVAAGASSWRGRAAMLSVSLDFAY